MNTDTNLFQIVKEVEEATHKSEISWTEIENTYCLRTLYKHKSIVICRYPDTDTKKIASFNFLGEDDYIIEPGNSWEEGTKEYQIISNLYDKVCSMISAYSCS